MTTTERGGAPDPRTARYKATTPVIALIPLLALMAVMFVIAGNRPDYEPYPSYDREYPALTGSPTPFDVAGLPYTLTVPGGLTTMPDPGEGDARFAPESWFPTDAGLQIGHEPLEGDFAETLKKHAAGATVTEIPTADGTTAHHWTDGGTEHVYITRNGVLLTLRSDAPQDGTDTTGALSKALKEMTASIRFRG